MDLSRPNELKGRRAAVIGSGVAGLAAAISLAVRGARVVVLEPSKSVGPTLRDRFVGPYRLPAWPPFLMDPSVFGELFASADFRLTDFLELRRPDSLCRFLLPDGSHFNLYHDSSKLMDEVRRVDPGSVRAMAAFLHLSRTSHAATEALYQSFGRSAWWRLLDASALAGMPLLFTPRRFGRSVERRFTSPLFRRVFESCRVLGGPSYLSDPLLATGWFSLFLQNGGWQIEGGLDALREALVRLCRELSVRFIRQGRVERIERQGGRVKRISGSGFKSFAVSLVVYTGEALDNLRAMLGHDGEVGLPHWRRDRNTDIQLLYGTSQQWPDRLGVSVVTASDPFEGARFLDRWRLPSADHPFGVYTGNAGKECPSGHGGIVIRVVIPRPDHRFTWSQERIEELEESIKERLARTGFDGARSAILDRRILAPEQDPRPGEPMKYWKRRPPLRVPLFELLRATPRVAGVAGLYAVPSERSGYLGPSSAAIAAVRAVATASLDA